MRRLTEQNRDDRGVVTLFVIGMITALLLASAAAIDVSRFSQENSSAQHSADATVVAVATDCANGISLGSVDYTKYYKSTSGQTINAPACGTGQTTITVTKNVNGGLLLSRDARTVTRRATARWGSIGTATTIPMVISNCEFTQAILVGTADITLYLDDAKPQSGCSSLPGGFSQLVNNNCAVTVSAGGTVPGDPGGDVMKEIPCITPLPKDILVPMYNASACTGTCNGHGPYPIMGFAMFHLTGYSFNGNKSGGTLGNKCPDTTRGKYCIRGDFIQFVTSQGSPGPSTDFGTKQVYLYS